MDIELVMTCLGILAGIILVAEILSFLRNVAKQLKRIADVLTNDAVPVKHGRWIAETERMGNYSHCSECGCRCRGYVPNYKYCPNCGAKMDLEG